MFLRVIVHFPWTHIFFLGMSCDLLFLSVNTFSNPKISRLYYSILGWPKMVLFGFFFKPVDLQLKLPMNSSWGFVVMVDTMPPGMFNEHTTKVGFGNHYSIQKATVTLSTQWPLWISQCTLLYQWGWDLSGESWNTRTFYIVLHTNHMGIVSSTISCGIEFNTHTTDYKFSVLIIFMIITDLLAYTLSNWVFFENQYYNLCLIVKFYIVFNPVQITEVKNRNQNNHNDACIP